MGKFEAKKTPKKQPAGKKRAKKKGLSSGLVIFLAVVIVALMVILVWLVSMESGEAAPIPTLTDPTDTTAAAPTSEPEQTENARVDRMEDIEITLDPRLKIVDIGSYTGVYMEDGSDEFVSGVLMLVVTNTGDEMIQLAEIQLSLPEGDAAFTLTTLPAGGSAVLLEQSRMAYDRNVDYSQAAASVDNVAVPAEPLTLHEDKLKLQTADGVINVTNISGEDITGEVCIYYKNSADDIYYGGITYVARLKEGIRDGEIRQIMASHFNQPGSTIMFVTVGQ